MLGQEVTSDDRGGVADEFCPIGDEHDRKDRGPHRASETTRFKTTARRRPPVNGNGPGVIRGPGGPIGGATRSYFFTRTWYPAAFSALTSSSASNSPVTSNVSALGLAVFPATPATLPTAALIARLHAPQQLWTPSSVSDL